MTTELLQGKRKREEVGQEPESEPEPELDMEDNKLSEPLNQPFPRIKKTNTGDRADSGNY